MPFHSANCVASIISPGNAELCIRNGSHKQVRIVVGLRAQKSFCISVISIQGVRVSDPATVEVAEMVLCGSINKGIASSIKRAGGRALGLSGKDDNLLMAKKLGKEIVDEKTGEVKVR